MKLAHVFMILMLLIGMILLAGGATFHHFSYWSAHASSLPAQIQDRPAAHFVGLNNLQPAQPIVASQSAKPAQPAQPAKPVANQTVDKTPQPGLVAAKTHTKPHAQTNTESQPEIRSAEPAPIKVVLENPLVQNQALNLQQVKPLETAAIAITRPGYNPKNNKFANEDLTGKPDQAFAVQPVLAVYNDYLTLDFAAELVTQQNVKRALGRVFLSPDPYAEEDLLSREPMNYHERPALYRQVLNQKNQPIRYPQDAFAYADHLLKAYDYKIKHGQAVKIKVPLYESNLHAKARPYEHWVMEFASQYNIKPALVFAVMETESNFNPRAISRSNAKGLMQIKTNSAGRDVYKLIDAKAGAPTDAELFDEASNIRLGVAYLSLLKYLYLADVKNQDIREMVAISAYNGGLSTVLKLFGETPEAAINNLNRVSKAKVYQTLRYQHASNETRQYLDKVLRAKAKYQALLGEDNQLLASR